jgi:hypothetical protein
MSGYCCDLLMNLIYPKKIQAGDWWGEGSRPSLPLMLILIHRNGL